MRAFPPDLAEWPAKEYPGQYPFRTDYGNIDLPWYRLRPGVYPAPGFGTPRLRRTPVRRRRPPLRAIPARTTARGEVEFSLIPGAKVRCSNADADLADLPAGERYQFHLYQDDSGAFRQASFVTDEVSELVRNGAVGGSNP